MVTQWFPSSREIQDTEVIKQAVGICLLGQNEILLVDYLEKGSTITAKYALRCTSLQTEAATGLQTLRQAFEKNLVSSRKCCSSQGGHYAPEIGRSSLLSSETPDIPPDLAPSDYYHFPNLKGRNFSSIIEATLTADGWFAAQPEEFFLEGLKKLEQRNHKCVELRGNV
jgi:hypothetical protein